MQTSFVSGAQDSVIFGRNEPALIHYHQAIRRELCLPIEGHAPRRAAEQPKPGACSQHFCR